MKLPVYFDYAATTPVDPRVIAKMQTCLGMDGAFGNPASRFHHYGRAANDLIDNAAMHVAELINVKPTEIIWTSGATEAINLAIKGAANFYRHNGRHIITCKTEHKAGLDTCRYLEKNGFQITYLTPQQNGLLDLTAFQAAIRPDTILVSIMHANNEIGVIQDITNIGRICRENRILFHVDAAQSLGKIPIDLASLPLDLMSFSGHKIYGPKGIGALYIREESQVRLETLIHGGGHQGGLRSGTLPTHQIVGMGEACKINQQEMSDEIQRLTRFRDQLWQGIAAIEGVTLNGDAEQRICNNLNFSINSVDGSALLLALKNLAISTGSACSSASMSLRMCLAH